MPAIGIVIKLNCVPNMIFSPYNDPELQDWIKWASEEGKADICSHNR
jgi:hypothetical protein